ncbi:aminoglycoside phosphotransferase, partial [mine drainage metagenome]
PGPVTSPRFPSARGQRTPYRRVPAHLRARWEALLGSPVVHARTQTGGFSPGVAARLELADGSRRFLKAVSAEVNPDSPEFYRREATVAAALPRGLSAPRFLWVDEAPAWVALAFEEVEGLPPPDPLASFRAPPRLVRDRADEQGGDPLPPGPPHLRAVARTGAKELAGRTTGEGHPTGEDPLRPLGTGPSFRTGPPGIAVGT